MDYTALKAEIESGPLADNLATLITAGNDTGIAAALNAPTYTKTGTMRRHEFAIWCGSAGLRAAIQNHADDVASPLRSVALLILDFLRGGISDSIDFSRVENQQMLAAWEQAGAITTAQKDALLAMATRPVGRAEYLFGAPVSADDIARALRG